MSFAPRSAQANAFQAPVRAMPIPQFVKVRVQVDQRFVVAEGSVTQVNLRRAVNYIVSGAGCFYMWPFVDGFIVLDVTQAQATEVVRRLGLPFVASMR